MKLKLSIFLFPIFFIVYIPSVKSQHSLGYNRDAADTIKVSKLITLLPEKALSNSKTFGYDNSRHWLRLGFKSTKNQYLIWANDFSFYNSIKYYLYDVTAHQFVAQEEMGIMKGNNFGSWDYLSASFQFETIKNHSYILVAGYKVSNGSIVVSSHLFTPLQFKKFTFKNNVISLLLIGLAFASFFIAVLLYFIKNLKIYIYYSTYVLGVIMVQGVNRGYFFYFYEGSAEQFMIVYAFTVIVFAISFLLFLLELLKTPQQKLINQKKIVYILSLLIFLTWFLGVFVFNTSAQRQIAVQVQGFWYFTVVCFTVYFLIFALKKKLPLRWYAIVSILPALITAVFMVLMNAGIMNYLPYFKYNFNVCLIVEVIIFGFAIVDFEKKKNAYSNLIHQKVKILKGIIEYKTLTVPQETAKKAYIESALSEEQVIRYLAQINSKVIDSKIYLDKELDLARLTLLTGIKLHLLSEIINRGTGKNWNEFINYYRLEEAKIRLIDKAYSNITIEGIGQDCGFSSKSTFFTVFKKSEGITPSQFRKEQKEKFDS